MSVIACVVMLCTVYALIHPAVALEETGTDIVCEIDVHLHDEDCYIQNDGQKSDVPVCGYADFVVHSHEACCYDEEGNLVCPLDEIEEHTHTQECYGAVNEEETTAQEDEKESEAELICDKTEIILHQHEKNCFDEDGSLICGKTEVLRHQHTEACFKASSNRIKERNLQEAVLNVALLYGDSKGQAEHPEGVSAYTHSAMSGYIKLEPSNLVADLTDVSVILTVPKTYVEKDSINIPEFSTDSEITKYEITPVSEDDENYYVSILFSAYDKTQTLVLPFALSFLNDVVPDNYNLSVTATVACEEYSCTTAPNIYKPIYKEWEISKFVNSNKLDAFRQDGAEVVVTPLEEGGNPYLDDLTYVDFAFMVNSVMNLSSNVNDFRDVNEVTLTDILPVYENKEGKICTAVFDPEVNPGWTLSEDGSTVSKTYTGENSADVLTQIYNDELHLRFPGLKFTIDEKGNIFADLENKVSFLAIPSNEAEGETRPEAEDSLLFRMTNDIGGKGIFTKRALKGDIYDVDVYKTKPYPWRICLTNEKPQPLKHIVIQDRKIVDGDQVVLGGLDEALKFVKLESEVSVSALPDGKTYADIVDRVVAYYTDGSTQEFEVDAVDHSGNFLILFAEDKICNGYEIIFDDAYEMNSGEIVSFRAYTVYRDPEHTHVTAEQERITYKNTARSVNRYTKGDETVYVYLTAGHEYDMLLSTENLQVTKETYYNNATQNNMVGDTYSYYIALRGSLLEKDVKEYEDLRIVDLLPNEVSYVRITSCGSASKGYLFDEGRSYRPEIVENYHNSGRTAVIFHFKADNLKRIWDNNHGLSTVIFEVKINADARPGTVRNDVYVVGDNLDEYQNATGGALDIYDLNNNGRTDDRIAYGNSDAIIVSAQSIFAEKMIAPAGTENWTKQGLILTPGAEFDYLLKVTNETVEDHTGLVIYDVLPAIGDKNVFGAQERNSEFSVCLREAITVPEGYSVYYTTNTDVYSNSMEAMISSDIWSNSAVDYEAVTAFKIAADEGTKLEGQSNFRVKIPVCVVRDLGEESLKKLADKDYKDEKSGTAAYLEAINNFGFITEQSASPKESNSVWARVSFAGFIVKKVDGESQNGIEGAEFTLMSADGKVIQTAASDEQGYAEFNNLTEGTYVLTETKVPEGYLDSRISINAEIKQHSATMEYTIVFDDSYSEAGNSSDPFYIENHKGYELPDTGGIGTGLCMAGGLSLMACGGFMLYVLTGRKKKNIDFS